MIIGPAGGWRSWLRHDAVLALVALCAAVLGAVLAGRYLMARAEAAETELAGRYAGRAVVVAASDLAPGDVLGTGNLAAREMPRTFLPPDAIAAEDAGLLMGSRASIAIRRGTPVVVAALHSGAEQPGLSTLLHQGERALTIQVDEVSSHAGGLRIGDRVDLHYVANRAGETVLVPLLGQVEVLAVGHEFGATGSAPEAAADERYATVTLRVADTDAPRILLAQQAGSLAVLLRAPRDGSVQDGAMRSSRELLRTARSSPGAAGGQVELLVGGGGDRIPERSWLRVGVARPLVAEDAS